jgi:hypothetical protein
MTHGPVGVVQMLSEFVSDPKVTVYVADSGQRCVRPDPM